VENIKDKTADLLGHAEELADTYYKLALLNVTQKAANITSAGITMIIVCTAAIFVLLFGGFALSWWLGDAVNSRAGGFLLGAGFFLIVMIVVVLLRKKIIFPFIRNLIIRNIYD
jgi:Putative Actinobacterial Holin-X, holin superfamily III